MSDIEFTIRKKVFTVFGAKFHIYNADGNLLGFVKQKAFKLKEDIRIFTDETATDERLVIKARSAIDFSASYDVIDSSTETKIGTLRRRGLKSMFRDEWQVLDENDEQVGTIKEDSMMMAMVRRFVLAIFPQKFHITDTDGNKLGIMKQNFNPFVQKLTVDVFDNFPMNPMIALASGVLILAIEGRQKS